MNPFKYMNILNRIIITVIRSINVEMPLKNFAFQNDLDMSRDAPRIAQTNHNLHFENSI